MQQSRLSTMRWLPMGMLVCLALTLSLAGCQSSIGGQTLPSGYYLDDDVQYYPPGPEFLLPNHAQALEDFRAQRQGGGAPPGGGPGGGGGGAP